MDALQIQKTKPPDLIKNALILYYRPTCPACVSCMPTFEKVPEALKSAGIQDLSIYIVDTNTIDISEAIGGQIQTVPKIIYVGSNGNVYVYPTTHRTVDKIVDFVKQSMSSTKSINAGSLTTYNDSLKKIDKETGMLGSLQTMIQDLFFTNSNSNSSKGLSGGYKKGFKSIKYKSTNLQLQTKRLKSLKSNTKSITKSITNTNTRIRRKIKETKSRSRRRNRNRHSKKYR